ncbi:MAG TPA: Na(+)-translocating NADH-quinone reductase subunit C [Candidatus Hydrogenedentes bacterium]|nr:MAG: Na(+)-translocating NADH-quinone reductase subunit C [Candidatus Hydrogenedentes bacterium ADurb.Bin170]HOD95076.1 Na(+)-translocating NADH-quinone reductase subunit C [Candidatus Hydrogenedentota bacterium]HOM48399.1 Na(+)-translocating NADH-quinone reductase subunit C [Candidatus Hydrogenedentota bacterium]HOR50472.1 Na(+)-translocating NADH-quinone reductase subunit C [Candidatus Hydrogenedentota bacterium]
MQYSMKYIFGFAAALCLICSVLISVANVGLRDRQEINKQLDKKKSVLQAACLIQAGEKTNRARIESLFENIRARVIDLSAGRVLDDVDSARFNEEDIPEQPAPANKAGIRTLRNQMLIYEVMDGDRISMFVLPIVGKGLWSTMYGFLALDADTKTIRGLTYYDQGETPGLGGEVTNPKWTALWPGRVAYDENWHPAITVVKGSAGSVEEAPHEVDGLSGATITSRSVMEMLRFWLGDDGFGPFLKQYRESGQA